MHFPTSLNIYIYKYVCIYMYIFHFRSRQMGADLVLPIYHFYKLIYLSKCYNVHFSQNCSANDFCLGKISLSSIEWYIQSIFSPQTCLEQTRFMKEYAILCRSKSFLPCAGGTAYLPNIQGAYLCKAGPVPNTMQNSASHRWQTGFNIRHLYSLLERDDRLCFLLQNNSSYV